MSCGLSKHRRALVYQSCLSGFLATASRLAEVQCACVAPRWVPYRSAMGTPPFGLVLRKRKGEREGLREREKERERIETRSTRRETKPRSGLPLR